MSKSFKLKRTDRKLARNSQRNFFISLILVIALSYATIAWFLPFVVNGIGFVKNKVSPSKKIAVSQDANNSLAPPVLSIPYEATNSSQINISGYASPDAKVKLYIDDVETQTISVSENGDFTFTAVALNLGTNNIYATTLDESNKESLPSKTIQLIFDNEKPSLQVSQPDDNKVISGGDKTITVSGQTDSDAQVFINSNQTIVNKDGNFSSNQSLNDGDNSFDIKAVDQAGNTVETSRKVTYNPS